MDYVREIEGTWIYLSMSDLVLGLYMRSSDAIYQLTYQSTWPCPGHGFLEYTTSQACYFVTYEMPQMKTKHLYTLLCLLETKLS